MSQRFQPALDDARKRTVRLEVRHVGANVAMVVALTPEKLGLTRPIAIVADAQEIGSTLDAIVAAGPQPAKQINEQRWHLRFVDGSGSTVLVVMTAIFAPFYGFIGDEPMSFVDGSLVRFLSNQYAPLDVPFLRD